MSAAPASPTPRGRLVLAVLLIGVASGLGGAAMSWTLHAVQDLAFGAGGPVASDPYARAEPLRRVLAVVLTGLVVSLLWWALRRPSPGVVSVPGMVAADTPVRRRPPFWRGVLNAFVQVVAVGGGASIGREVAPRELGGLFAGRIGDALGLDAAQRRVMVACGAAAGLAAVYHVPLAGAVFALEVLLGAFSVEYAIMALGTSALATVVARLTVSTEPFYRVEAVGSSLPVLGVALVVGLVLALPARGFRRAVKAAESRRLTGWRQLWGLPATFLLTAAAALALPQALGNGLAAAQWAYDDGAGTGPGDLPQALLLLGTKTVLVLLTLWCGAVGGTLTPGFALGALAGSALADLAALAFPQLVPGASPGADAAAWAVLGAAAFLAVSMDAPLTALLLAVGFTEQPASAALPLVVAVAAACGLARLVSGRRRPSVARAAL